MAGKKLTKEIVLGKYSGDDIVWLPIKSTIQEDRVLCIAKHPVGFINIEDGEQKKKLALVKNWLVKDFSKKAFSKEESDKIFDTNGSKAFLLDLAELDTYVPLPKDRKRVVNVTGKNKDIKKKLYLECKTIDGKKVFLSEQRNAYPINWIIPDKNEIKFFKYYTLKIEDYFWDEKLGIIPAIWMKI